MKKRMTKQIAFGALALLLALGAVGCGTQEAAETTQEQETTQEETEAAESAEESEEEVTAVTYPDDAYLHNIKAEDYITLPDYEKIPVEVSLVSVTDEDIEDQIAYALSTYQDLQEVTDRDTVQEGDVVNIDFAGTKDGVAFDGGTFAGYDLEIGSGSFIPGFEDGLIGKKVGETVSLDLTFPESYGNADLAGEDVVFEVTVNSIQEYIDAELNDEFVEGLGLTDDDGNEITTVEGLRDYIRDYLEEDAEAENEDAIQNAVLNYMLDNSTYTEPFPQPLTDRLTSTLTTMFESYATMYGMELNEFMEEVVGDEDEGSGDEILANMTTDYAKQLLLVKAVADAENLTISDEEFEEEIEELAESAGYEAEEYQSLVDLQALREELLGDKVIALLTGRADVTEVEEETEE